MKQCQESWKSIVIDEFQDTSAMQYGLLRILASHKKITIVGDEDQVYLSLRWHLYKILGCETSNISPITMNPFVQLPDTPNLNIMSAILQSIFSFNGADAFGFNSFRKDFPMHKEVLLFLYILLNTLKSFLHACTVIDFHESRSTLSCLFSIARQFLSR